MTALHHIYVTAHGEYTVGSWVGETAQIGLRLAVESEGSLPAKGGLFEPFSGHGDVVADAGTLAGTHGTLTRSWTSRMGTAGSSENADAAFQVDLAEDVWVFLNTIKGVQNNTFRWTHIKIAPILADGKYGAGAALYSITTPLAGAVSTATTPPELAVAVSMRGAVLGRRGRGRVYVPALTIASINAADGTISVTTQNSLAAALVTLITDLENGPGTEVMTPLVMVTSAGAPMAVRPSQVRIGSHWDVQRRRQSQVPEVYATTAL